MQLTIVLTSAVVGVPAPVSRPMTRCYSQPPDRIPGPGTVLNLAVEDVQYRDTPLRLHIERSRPDISLWYDGQWIWLEGVELAEDGAPIQRVQALVRVAAIP